MEIILRLFFIFLIFIGLTDLALAGPAGIFPNANTLGLTRENYWRLCGELGILGGYLFWSQVFK